MSSVIGLLVLAIEIALVTFVTAVWFRSDSWLLTFCLAYIVLAPTALYLWHSKKSPKSTSGWFQLAAGSVVFGALFFVCDIFVAHWSHPDLPLLDAATQGGGPFGFGMTLLVCPGLTMIAIGGVARMAFIRARQLED